MVFKLSMYSICKFKGTSKDRPFQLFRCEVVEHVPFTKPFGLLHGSTVPSDAIKSQGCVACTALRTPHSPLLKLRRNGQLRQSSPLNTRTDPNSSFAWFPQVTTMLRNTTTPLETPRRRSQCRRFPRGTPKIKPYN